MTPLEKLNIEEAIDAAFEAGQIAGAELVRWQVDQRERQQKYNASEQLAFTAKVELDALKTLGQIGGTFASLAEAISKGMQSRRNQL